MIIRSGRDAAYWQLADLLRAEIQSGRIPPGELLPFEGRLQQEHDVGRQTVRAALRVLREEGLVVTERGYGTRVRQPVERERVKVPRGAEVISRPALVEERTELEIEPGDLGWVLVVTIGGRERTYVAERTVLTFA